MLFRELCEVIGTNNVLKVYDVQQEVLAQALVSYVMRDRWYLMDKEVLCVNAEAETMWPTDMAYIEVTLNTVKGE